jgi:hypothetical protein
MGGDDGLCERGERGADIGDYYRFEMNGRLELRMGVGFVCLVLEDRTTRGM